MRTTMVLLVLLVGALTWTALPATAGDDDEARIAQLEANVVRFKAEAKQLREAYDQLSQSATRGVRALNALTISLNAARDMVVTLTTQRDELRGEVQDLRTAIAKRPDDDPARLKLALSREERAHTTDVSQLMDRVEQETERANRNAINRSGAENALARAKKKHAVEVTALVAKLAGAAATIEQLSRGK